MLKRSRLDVIALAALLSLTILRVDCFVTPDAWAIAHTGRAEQNRAETSADRDQRMRWWRDARFGMFIHWGLYAVPAGDFEGHRSKEIGEWIMSWANIPRARYEKFAAQFNPVQFDAAEWVRIA